MLNISCIMLCSYAGKNYYYAHTMLMNIINLLYSTHTHAPIHLSDLVVITKWLRVQEVAVTTVTLILLTDS